LRVLTRYFCKEFFKLLALVLTIALSIYLIIDFVQRLNDFLDVHIPMRVLFLFLFYKTPFIITQILPVSTLIAIIVMFSLMKKNNEITAMKASGINMFEISKPVIFVSILVAGIMFLFSELIVPYASSRSNEIWNIEVKKNAPTRFYGHDHIWYRGANALYLIRRFDSKKNVMLDLSLYFFDKSFQLIKRIDARKGVWTGHNWKIQEGIVQEVKDEGGYSLMKFDEIQIDLPEGPEVFVRPVRKPEEMSYWQLKRYAERVRIEGYDDTEYLVDMNIKLALPLVNLLMVLIGIPVALGIKRGGTPLAVSLGVGFCFLYLINLGFLRSLGLSGMLPPVLAAWSANVIFFFLGIYMMMRLKA
jgi:lipopolysaccharide export system permease protein